MQSYDPEVGPVAVEWLDVPEADRLEMVTAYHRRRRIPVPNPELHAVVHMVVENQVALGEKDVVGALERLQDEGLDRHEAIHAIGLVLSEHIYGLLKDAGPGEGPPDVHRAYYERLRDLTADDWLRSDEPDDR